MGIGSPAYEQLRDILRNEIITGMIPSSTHLTIIDTAKRFGVSHMPVREAFQWLQGEGLLKILPHRGARVLSLNINYVRDIYELSAIIAGLLAQQSAVHLKPALLAKIDKIHNQFCTAAELKDQTKLLALNSSFHDNIYSFAKNSEAQKTYRLYVDLLRTLRLKFGFTQARIKEMVQEHTEILDALHSKNKDLIQKAIRRHYEGAANNIIHLMEKNSNIL
jgi:DNA-binding GntR family transcriptional regulator